VAENGLRLDESTSWSRAADRPMRDAQEGDLPSLLAETISDSLQNILLEAHVVEILE
jgi:hypothetical protein